MSADYFEQELGKNATVYRQLTATVDQLRANYHEAATQCLADWLMSEATAVITREQIEITKNLEDSALSTIKTEVKSLMERTDAIVKETLMNPSLWQDFSKPVAKVQEMTDLAPVLQKAGQNLGAALQKHGYKINFAFTGNATMSTLMKQHEKCLTDLALNLRQKNDLLEQRSKFEVKRRWENA